MGRLRTPMAQGLGGVNTKVPGNCCISCGEEIVGRRRDALYCLSCRDHRQTTRVRRRVGRTKAIERAGGKCKRCGGTFHPALYEFHHRDPEDKTAKVSNLYIGSEAKLFAEVDKCDLLCRNCHALTHVDKGDWG